MKFLILFALTAPQAPKPPQAPPVIEQRVFALETKVSWLENDVAAIKRDISAKCDVASKSPEPKPAAKCPDGICADCKCTVGEDCGCLKLAGSELVAIAKEPVAYREVRTCRDGVCTVQMVAVDATDETPQVMLRDRPSYGSGGCPGGNCGVGAAGRVVKGFRLFRRR